eukprot:UN34272
MKKRDSKYKEMKFGPYHGQGRFNERFWQHFMDFKPKVDLLARFTHPPCAFHGTLKGYRGLYVLHPDTEDTSMKAVVRTPSMLKFIDSSIKKQLSIYEFAFSRPCFTNHTTLHILINLCMEKKKDIFQVALKKHTNLLMDILESLKRHKNGGTRGGLQMAIEYLKNRQNVDNYHQHVWEILHLTNVLTQFHRDYIKNCVLEEINYLREKHAL